jgi:hypothetical protein
MMPEKTLVFAASLLLSSAAVAAPKTWSKKDIARSQTAAESAHLSQPG